MKTRIADKRRDLQGQRSSLQGHVVHLEVVGRYVENEKSQKRQIVGKVAHHTGNKTHQLKVKRSKLKVIRLKPKVCRLRTSKSNLVGG